MSNRQRSQETFREEDPYYEMGDLAKTIAVGVTGSLTKHRKSKSKSSIKA